MIKLTGQERIEYEDFIRERIRNEIRADGIADIVIWAIFSAINLMGVIMFGSFGSLLALIICLWLMFIFLKERDEAQAQIRSGSYLHLREDNQQRDRGLSVTSGHSM